MNKLFIFITCFLIQLSLLAGPLVVLPAKDKGKKVVVVDSSEYKELLKNNKQIVEQLELEKKNWELYAKEVARQKEVNEQNQNKLIDDYNKLTAALNKEKSESLKKTITIWKLRGVIGLLLVLAAVAIWLRIKGIL